jgi:hypothetical protein
MRPLFTLFLFSAAICNGQLTIEKAKETAQPYHLGQYSYHEQFIGHPGYGAPVILTADGGAAAYGDGEYKGTESGLLIKFDKTGKVQWQRPIKKQFSEMESQSVVQDKTGNFYVFMLSYDEKRYRGGSERIIYIDKTGVVKWDKTIGSYTLMNNPTVAYIRAENNGGIYMRGQTVVDKPEDGKDPKYRFWEGWLNSAGKLTEKTGDIIVWGNDQPWQKFFAPEK